MKVIFLYRSFNAKELHHISIRVCQIPFQEMSHFDIRRANLRVEYKYKSMYLLDITLIVVKKILLYVRIIRSTVTI